MRRGSRGIVKDGLISPSLGTVPRGHRNESTSRATDSTPPGEAVGHPRSRGPRKRPSSMRKMRSDDQRAIGWGHPLSGTKDVDGPFRPLLDGAIHPPLPRKCGWPPPGRFLTDHVPQLRPCNASWVMIGKRSASAARYAVVSNCSYELIQVRETVLWTSLPSWVTTTRTSPRLK